MGYWTFLWICRMSIKGSKSSFECVVYLYLKNINNVFLALVNWFSITCGTSITGCDDELQEKRNMAKSVYIPQSESFSCYQMVVGMICHCASSLILMLSIWLACARSTGFSIQSGPLTSVTNRLVVFSSSRSQWKQYSPIFLVAESW